MPVRMRSPKQALEELKKEDPKTPLTLNYIRSLAASGKIPVAKVGRRYLINYDGMLEYLANPQPAPKQYGVIRKIAE